MKAGVQVIQELKIMQTAVPGNRYSLLIAEVAAMEVGLRCVLLLQLGRAVRHFCLSRWCSGSPNNWSEISVRRQACGVISESPKPSLKLSFEMPRGSLPVQA